MLNSAKHENGVIVVDMLYQLIVYHYYSGSMTVSIIVLVTEYVTIPRGSVTATQCGRGSIVSIGCVSMIVLIMVTVTTIWGGVSVTMTTLVREHVYVTDTCVIYMYVCR